MWGVNEPRSIPRCSRHVQAAVVAQEVTSVDDLQYRDRPADGGVLQRGLP